MDKPWQQQAEFSKMIAEVKAPINLNVIPHQRMVEISWRRIPGKVDGFIILLGSSPEKIEERKRVSKGMGFDYNEKIFDLIDGQTYYISVVTYNGVKRSELPGIWKVIPNMQSKLRPAQKIESPQVVISENHNLDITPLVEKPKNDLVVLPPKENLPVVPLVQVVDSEIVFLCSHCSGDVVLNSESGLYNCRTCGAKYVQRVFDSKYILVDALINGICRCCNPKRPMIKPPNEEYKKCSFTGESYVELPGRGLIRISDLDYGLCTCCNPQNPLMLNQQSQVVCSVKREHLYVRNGAKWVLRPPETPISLLDEIDAALANGSAGMLANGVLVSGAPSPKRRRR